MRVVLAGDYWRRTAPGQLRAGPDRDTLEGISQRPRAFHVVGIQPGQLEPGGGQQLIDRAVEVTAAERAALQRGEQLLEAGDPRIGRQAVLSDADAAASTASFAAR